MKRISGFIVGFHIAVKIKYIYKYFIGLANFYSV